jgi:hypothetical protein
MTKHTSIAVLLLAAVVSACGSKMTTDITAPVAASKVKFFNFGVNAPAVNFYAGTTKMTAISSTTFIESVLGTNYGSAGSGGFYASIAPGSYALSANIAAATDKDLAISKVTATIADGKSYSFYTSGFYDATAKSVEGFVVEDGYPATIDYTQSLVRFVNAISNSQPMILYAKDQLTGTEVAVGAAIAYKAGGTFVGLPQGVYDLSARLAGSTTNLFTRTSVSFNTGRVYTIGGLGDITVTSTTAANRARLDNTANR